MFPNKERLSYMDGDNPLTELLECCKNAYVFYL